MHRVNYPAGGWLAPGTPINWQRNDLGKDLVIPWRGIIQAPGSGYVVTNGSDRPFPDGFGPSFIIVRIETGSFAGKDWYIGHCTSLRNPGERFAFGEPLARADQGHNFEGTHGGWVELGEFANGRCGTDLHGAEHWFTHLLYRDLVVRAPDKVLKFGMQGPRVVWMTKLLRDCGWLPRPYWRFNRPVHGAVIAFQDHHRLNPDGIVGDRMTVVLRHAAHWCRRHHRKENRR